MKIPFSVTELLVEEKESCSCFLSREKVGLTAARRRLVLCLRRVGGNENSEVGRNILKEKEDFGKWLRYSSRWIS